MAETTIAKRVRPRRVKESMGTSIAASAHTRSGRILVWIVALLWTVPTFGVLVSLSSIQKSKSAWLRYTVAFGKSRWFAALTMPPM